MTLWAQQRGGAVVSVESLPLGLRAANAVVAYAAVSGSCVVANRTGGVLSLSGVAVGDGAGAGVFLAGVSGVGVWRGRRERPWLVGWLWYLATLLPVIGLVQVGGQSLADRYTYVPLMGVFIMVVWGWPNGMMARRMGRMAAAGTGGGGVVRVRGVVLGAGALLAEQRDVVPACAEGDNRQRPSA